MKFHIQISSEVCKGCGLCVAECPKNVIEIGDKFNSKGWQFSTPTRNDDCIGCRRCATVCPDVAIKVIKED